MRLLAFTHPRQPNRAAMGHNFSPTCVEPPQSCRPRVFEGLFELAVMKTPVDLRETGFSLRFVDRIILIHDVDISVAGQV